ncbi:phospho-N-acetylmuramoyl-pentapeptide-transferase [Oscillospiraceae bacterium MB08-C2-2]|nr:phospho-N-acetylmuramoyl-pentapeptide-transferase [Oscillospiraceae bacterium MB08-C2-2]
MKEMPVLSAVLVAFVVTAVLGLWLVPLMRRLKYGQTILDIGPAWHKKSKQGTPTMGGLMFIVGTVAAIIAGYMTSAAGGQSGALLWAAADKAKLLLGALMALAFGMVGFADDFIKVVKKRNLGLNARQKLVMQFLIALVYLGGLYLVGERSSMVFVPFFGWLQLGPLYWPLAMVGIVYLVNCVNLTDGLDGLCASVTLVSALGFIILCTLLPVPGVGIMAGALAGGCLGFLIWNFHPAKIFMGDTGSMFLGGMVVALAFSLGIPIILLFMGILYICEGLSVVLQVISFKTTGKRIFKMSPIHHHFEMSGWSEVKIVVVFSLIQLIGCIVAAVAVRGM